jgi:hypothetical protein
MTAASAMKNATTLTQPPALTPPPRTQRLGGCEARALYTR